MGRIDEAMRRAAEEAVPGDLNERATSARPGIDDVETLAREAFPIEMDERRRVLRPVGVPSPNRPAAVASPVQPGPAPRPAVPDAPPAATSALNVPADRAIRFEQIDSSLVGKIVIDDEIAPASREQYRRLAATLHQAQAVQGLKVVMVTSALMGEGKTLTASNLALTLSESYKKRVLLIDGDLRRPGLHTLFKIDASPGLSEGLTAAGDQRLAVRQVSPQLGILTAGQPSSDPMAGLTSPRMRQVIEEARDAFDWVIIDTPPVALLPDANLLASMADGAVMVVRAGSTPWDLAQRAVATLGKERVLGVVLNRSTASPNTNYGYYYTAPAPNVTPSP